MHRRSAEDERGSFTAVETSTIFYFLFAVFSERMHLKCMNIEQTSNRLRSTLAFLSNGLTSVLSFKFLLIYDLL